MSESHIYKTRLSLLQRLKETGDDSSWKEFAAIYQKYLYVVVRNMGQSHHDTEEIVQAVFAKVWERLPQFEYLPRKGRFRHWLCAIAKNMTFDRVRHNDANIRLKDKLKESPFYDKSIQATPEVIELADKEWKNYLANHALEDAKKVFNETMIEIFTSHVKGVSIKEIASGTGLAENTTYVYCKKVKDYIKKRILQLDAEWA